jgi:hypothetical protein
MRDRPLGGTAIEVSGYRLGTMMFGAIGHTDHDDCVRIVHAALHRIDEIVPPGTDLAGVVAPWTPPSPTDPPARRRPAGLRSAA